MFFSFKDIQPFSIIFALLSLQETHGEDLYAKDNSKVRKTSGTSLLEHWEKTRTFPLDEGVEGMAATKSCYKHFFKSRIRYGHN